MTEHGAATGLLTSRMKNRLGLAVVAAAVAAAGCSTASDHRPSSPMSRDGSSTPARDTHATFPDRTASDVVSYADYVAVVTPVAERKAMKSGKPVYEDQGRYGRGIVRRVTVRVDHVLWMRDGAPQTPARFKTIWGGWLVGQRQPYAVAGAQYTNGTPPVFLDDRYVMPIAFDGVSFVPIQPGAVFRLGDGIIVDRQRSPLARALKGASRREVAKVFATAEPDPLAVHYQDLLPQARLSAVLATRGS